MQSQAATFGFYTKFVARPGQRDRLVEVLIKATQLVKNAPGCRLYIVNVSPAETDTVWVTEIWDSDEHYRASLAAPGVPELIAEAMLLMGAEPLMISLAPVADVGLTPQASVE